MDKQSLKYPIGKFSPPVFNSDHKKDALNTLEDFPFKLEKFCKQIQPEDFYLSYRPGGWTILQTIHHCCDSHLNAFIRFKLALTEDNPSIKPYIQEAWTQTGDKDM